MQRQEKTILVVDDDDDILDSLQVILEEEGYTIVTANRGENLAERLKENRPDLILLDMLLSGTNGCDLARQLKGQEATSSIRILMFSAHPSAEQTALACGADAFIAKPFDIEELVEKVAQLLP